MKEHEIKISQNGWEYTGYAWIKCDKVEKIDRDRILVNGHIEITFDEAIEYEGK